MHSQLYRDSTEESSQVDCANTETISKNSVNSQEN